ncbi:FtsK/SpoIIIE domain-containing protein [Amycolatopsis sp. NPDC059027]|uniref:FtsK/SpoIIIE domain-containing protein n=1 Tax=Amycolatopsis sp. NPDC059027 TaxID=3346709 RepID=UPI00366FB3A1
MSTHDDTNDTTTTTTGSAELATVHRLPVPADTEVIEGELISDEEYQRRTSQKARMLARYQGYRRDVVTVAKVTKTVATHERTKTLGKGAARHVSYVFGGGYVLAKRAWEAKTNSRYERQMRIAETSGNAEELKEWEQRAEMARERRHRRRMDWVNGFGKLLKVLVLGSLALVVALLVLGIVLAIKHEDIDDVFGPIEGLFSLIEWIAYAVTVAWGPFLLAAPWLAAGTLWYIGKNADAAPKWMQTGRDGAAEGGMVVTADGIVTALRYLPIARLKEAFKKEGWSPRFDLTPTREGSGAFKGYSAIFDLPMGVPPKDIADVAPVLAKNLHRNPVEVWVSDYGKEKGGKPGYVKLYVADSGVMEKPVPDYPLLSEGKADVFEGVPMGITQRGDGVKMPIVGSNAVFGGQPGQGKSNAVRVVVLGCALDPLCEIRVHVFAMNGDFDAYQPRLAVYEKGATSEHVELAVAHLQALYDEVGRREERLAELGAKKLTRQISEQHPDMRPLLVGFSECHELFGNGTHGKLAAELAVNVVKRGRKTGVSLVFDTQSSRADAIPSQLVENVGANGCFAVKTWRSNDGFLGDGSFAAGIRATELRFNVDRGTMVATGMTDEMFEIVRTYFVKVDDDAGWDQATEVIERAMAQLAPGTPVRGDRPTPQPEADRDLLEDLAEVLDDVPVPAGQVIGALRTLAPKWRPYQDLTIPKLVAALKKLGVKVPSTRNQFPIDPVTVREALARQATADLDE